MNEDNIIGLTQPNKFEDALTDVLRDGASRLLASAIEAEVAALLAAYQDQKLSDGRQRVVRHGTLPEREVQTGIGSVKVKVPRVRDRGDGQSVSFNSRILPNVNTGAKTGHGTGVKVGH